MGIILLLLSPWVCKWFLFLWVLSPYPLFTFTHPWSSFIPLAATCFSILPRMSIRSLLSTYLECQVRTVPNTV